MSVTDKQARVLAALAMGKDLPADKAVLETLITAGFVSMRRTGGFGLSALGRHWYETRPAEPKA
jgi:hypothetical protein